MVKVKKVLGLVMEEVSEKEQAGPALTFDGPPASESLLILSPFALGRRPAQAAPHYMASTQRAAVSLVRPPDCSPCFSKIPLST